MVEKENEEVKKAVETLNRISLDPVERERYESIVQAEFNRATSERNFFKAGREEGREEGKKEKQKEIAKKLLEMSMKIEDIEKATGLTKEEIANLKNEN